MTEDLQLMRAPRKAKAILDRLVASRQITESGLRWLIGVTDPFHDTNIEWAGFPDLNSASTIVQCYTETFTISAPTIVGAAGYDCHILFNPALPCGVTSTANVFSPFLLNAGTSQILNSTTGAIVNPGWNVFTGAVGLDLAAFLTATIIPLSLAVPPKAIGGQYRLVASAVEVVNTTAELYKNGAVTVWRAPAATPQIASVFPAVAATSPPVEVLITNAFPTNQAEAMLYPTSKTWAAELGVYQICTMVDDQNPFKMAVASPVPGIVTAASNAQIAASAFVNAWFDASVNLLNFGNFAGSTAVQMAPFALNGMIFSGLTNQTTLQVTVKYSIERMPSVSEPDFLVLARAPTDYDPMALEIYTRAINELPIAVCVGENPLGEWFNDVLDAVAEYAPSIGGLFGPAGAAMGSALGAGAQWMKSDRQKSPEALGQPSNKQEKMNNLLRAGGGNANKTIQRLNQQISLMKKNAGGTPSGGGGGGRGKRKRGRGGRGGVSANRTANLRLAGLQNPY